MSWWVVIIILFIGWLLVFFEVFFIPGTALFALIGTLTMIVGVVIAYSTFGVIVGTITLFGTAIFSFISIVFGFKSGLLRGLTLKTQNKGRANEIDESRIKSGDAGVALSKIAPIGKGLFNEVTYEVQTLGEWVIEGTPIEVIKISMNKIFVKASDSKS